MPLTLDELTQKMDALDAQCLAAQKRAERAEAILKFNPEQRAVFEKLNETDQTAFLEGDETVRSGFVAKHAPPATDDRADLLKRMEAAESAARANAEALKSVEARAAAAESIAKAEIEKRQRLEFQKRAETEFPNLPGSVEKKGGVLAAISKLSGDEQKDILELLASGNAALKQLGVPVGTDTQGVSSADTAWSRIEKKADAKRATDTKLTKDQAVNAVLLEDPTLYREYMKELKPTA